MDIKYHIVTPDDERYGGRMEGSERWTGMVGMVVDNVRYIFYFNINYKLYQDLIRQ